MSHEHATSPNTKAPPDEAADLFYKGTHLMDNDMEKAEIAFHKALDIFPDFPEVHANLALLLEHSRNFKRAEYHYNRALELDPNLLQAYLNLGVMLDRQQRFDDAETIYRQALALNPESPAAWSNLGALLAGMKREAEAEQCHRKALALNPSYHKASFNLAYLLLRHGRFEEGWDHLESRQWYIQLENHLNCPRWRGEPLQGKSLLIGFEAGHGDMIQFCRYAALAKQNGADRISILCHPALKPLFSEQHILDEAISADEPLAADGWDYWVPPLSLPYMFKTRLDSIPNQLPYLMVASERIEHMGKLIGPAHGQLRVGLVWKGNPHFENDNARSLASPADLAPLGDVTNVQFFSLQKSTDESEPVHIATSLPMTDLAPNINDFADTAAIIENLDLVISVDTSVAHLAGALGKRCWVLLPDYKPDWRWLSKRNDSPWYPGIMRLFRQPSPSDWESVIIEVKKKLQELVATG